MIIPIKFELLSSFHFIRILGNQKCPKKGENPFVSINWINQLMIIPIQIWIIVFISIYSDCYRGKFLHFPTVWSVQSIQISWNRSTPRIEKWGNKTISLFCVFGCRDVFPLSFSLLLSFISKKRRRNNLLLLLLLLLLCFLVETRKCSTWAAALRRWLSMGAKRRGKTPGVIVPGQKRRR